MERDLFPAARASATPADRTSARDAAVESPGMCAWVGTMVLCALFALTPGVVCAGSLVLGRVFGEWTYRFGVTWLFFWAALLLTLDPFVARYRRTLMDAVHHWRVLARCSQTALNVCFDHGLVYYAALWAAACTFPLLEALLAVAIPKETDNSADRDHDAAVKHKTAVHLTTLVFSAGVVVALVVWLGRVLAAHGLIVAGHRTYGLPRPTPAPPHATLGPRAPASSPVIKITQQAPLAAAHTGASTAAAATGAAAAGAAAGAAAAGAAVRVDEKVAFDGAPVPVRVDVGGGVWVVLRDGPSLRPDVQLDGNARLDLVSHLQRNARQLTVDHNALTFELSPTSTTANHRPQWPPPPPPHPVSSPPDGAAAAPVFVPADAWFRRGLWGALAVLGAASLVLTLREALDLFSMDVWAEYATFFGLSGCVLLVAHVGGRRGTSGSGAFFFQLFLLLNTTLPALYGSWLLSTYSALVIQRRDRADDAASAATGVGWLGGGVPWTTVVLLMHMAVGQVYWAMTAALVSRVSAPYLYARYLMLPQLLSYLVQYVIFGFTPWSLEYVLVLVLTSLHNVLSSTGVYADLAIVAARCVRYHFCRHTLGPPRPALNTNTNQQQQPDRFERLMRTRHAMQVFGQDTVADVWSFVVVASLVFVLWCADVPITELLPNFTVEPLTLRLSVLVVVRGLAWILGQFVFRRKFATGDDHEQGPGVSNDDDLEARGPSGVAHGSGLAGQLEAYLATLGRSTFETAGLHTCYEDDAPELFAAAPATARDVLHTTDDSMHTNSLRTNNAASAYRAAGGSWAGEATLGAAAAEAEVSERQQLLHPSLLRKHFLYYHAVMYYLLFVVFQSTALHGALRYAWYRPPELPNLAQVPA